MSTFGDRETALAHIATSEASVTALKVHVQEIVEGPAFKGSHRSGQFLSYIVDHAIRGHFESLKERVIGIELFGRSPSYDTSEDAIVRVTASDVRKRLLQHYGRQGETSEFRVSLPPGSYVPEIIYTPHREKEPHENHSGLLETHQTPAGEAAAQHQTVDAPAKAEEAKALATGAALPGEKQQSLR